MQKEIPILASEHYIKEKCGINVKEEAFKRVNDSHFHLHTYYTIDIITGGSGTHFINDRKYPIKKGAVHLIRPSDIHCITCNEGDVISAVTIRFNESAVGSEYRSILMANHGVYYPAEEIFSRLCVYAMALKEYSTIDLPYAQRSAVMNFGLILTEISRLKGLEQEIYEQREETVSLALKYIDMHFRENPTLKQTADYVGLTPQYFSLRFKNKTGKTYTDYLTALKINYACNALKIGMSVTEACFTSGFGSVSNFNSLFKRYKGITPLEYKKRKKGAVSLRLKCTNLRSS